MREQMLQAFSDALQLELSYVIDKGVPRVKGEGLVKLPLGDKYVFLFPRVASTWLSLDGSEAALVLTVKGNLVLVVQYDTSDEMLELSVHDRHGIQVQVVDGCLERRGWIKDRVEVAKFFAPSRRAKFVKPKDGEWQRLDAPTLDPTIDPIIDHRASAC